MNKKTVPLNHHRLRGTVLLFHDSFTPELCQHLQHVDADLLWIIIQTGADDAETIRCQNPAMQLVGLVLLVLLIFLVRYLFHGNPQSCSITGIYQRFIFFSNLLM